MSKHNSDKNGQNGHDLRLSEGDLMPVDSLVLEAQKQTILEANALKMQEAKSRGEISEIADQTLKNLAELYGRSEHDLGRAIINEVYKPAFAAARTIDSGKVVVSSDQSAAEIVAKDGFVLELNEDEISSLADKDLLKTAKDIFFAALKKITVSTDRSKNLEIAEKATGQLLKLYSKSAYYSHDFPRLEGQLYNAVKQRNEFLKQWQQNPSSEI